MIINDKNTNYNQIEKIKAYDKLNIRVKLSGDLQCGCCIKGREKCQKKYRIAKIDE